MTRCTIMWRPRCGCNTINITPLISVINGWKASVDDLWYPVNTPSHLRITIMPCNGIAIEQQPTIFLVHSQVPLCLANWNEEGQLVELSVILNFPNLIQPTPIPHSIPIVIVVCELLCGSNKLLCDSLFLSYLYMVRSLISLLLHGSWINASLEKASCH